MELSSNKHFSTPLPPKVRCPFTVGNSLLQCKSCFHSEDGFKPTNLKSFQLHAASIHCNPQLGPGQPLPDRYSEWYPQASYASCKHPGCPYRIIFTSKRLASYLQQHEAHCLHNPESIRANTAQLEQVLQPFNRSKNRRSQARATTISRQRAPTIQTIPARTPSARPALTVPESQPEQSTEHEPHTERGEGQAEINQTNPSTPSESVDGVDRLVSEQPAGLLQPEQPAVLHSRTQPENQELQPEQPAALLSSQENNSHASRAQAENHYSFFNTIPWDAVLLWHGTTLQSIPNKCRPIFRDLGNELFDLASTGSIAAIKAAWLFARLILFSPPGLRGQLNHKLVSNRLHSWSEGNFEFLMSDLKDYDDSISSRDKQKPRDTEKFRNFRVLNRVKVGELSKGLQSAMPSTPFAGPVQELINLHPSIDASAFINGPPQLQTPTEDHPHPTVDALAFHRAICSASRGTAQTVSGMMALRLHERY